MMLIQRAFGERDIAKDLRIIRDFFFFDVSVKKNNMTREFGLLCFIFLFIISFGDQIMPRSI